MTHGERIAAVVATAVVVLLVLTDAVPLLRGPAPYPPEWRWERRVEAPPLARYAWPAVSAGLLLGLLAASGSRGFRAHPRRGAGVLLLGAVVLGASVQLGLLDLEPAGALRTLTARVLSRTDTAYYTVAVSDDARDPVAFLDRHADLLVGMRRTAKHAATHPPGPVLYYRAWIALAETSPALTRAALGLARLEPGQGPTARPPNTPASVAGAIIGGGFVLVLCAAACVPIAVLFRVLGADTLGAARAAALWPLGPGAALMSPQFDQALAFPVACAVALLALATTYERAGLRWATALGAGVLAFAAGFVSFGSAAFVAIGGFAVVAALAAPDARHAAGRRMVQPVALAGAGSLACLALLATLGYDALASARTALAFHRESYTAPRSYALWLVFNPIDFAVFLGAPLVAIGLLRLARPLTTPPARYRAAFLAGLALLLASGTVRGELGRIGVPLMALALPAALADDPLTPRDVITLGALLASLCLALRASWLLP